MASYSGSVARTVLFCGALAVMSTSTLASPRFSADTTVELDGVTFEDQDVVEIAVGMASPISLGALPENADVISYHRLSSGDQLFALDVSAELADGLAVCPGDVIRYDGATYTLELDAIAAGIPDGLRTDAVTLSGVGGLVLSFDGSGRVGGVDFADEDLVQFYGGVVTMAFDGSAEGVPEELDLDGASYEPALDWLLVSFDGSGRVGGVDFDDEDVLAYDGTPSGWRMLYEGSAEHAKLAAADVLAVPEPRTPLGIRAGCIALGLLDALRRRRERARSEP